jgi:hypothetical protein
MRQVRCAPEPVGRARNIITIVILSSADTSQPPRNAYLPRLRNRPGRFLRLNERPSRRSYRRNQTHMPRIGLQLRAILIFAVTISIGLQAANARDDPGGTYTCSCAVETGVPHGTCTLTKTPTDLKCTKGPGDTCGTACRLVEQPGTGGATIQNQPKVQPEIKKLVPKDPEIEQDTPHRRPGKSMPDIQQSE